MAKRERVFQGGTTIKFHPRNTTQFANLFNDQNGRYSITASVVDLQL